MKKAISFVLSAMCAVIGCLVFCFAPVAAAKAEGAYCGETRYGSSEFRGGRYQGVESRTVEYSYYTKDRYVNQYSVSNFVVSGKVNACAVSAGGNICTYYDRLYSELIPNYQPYYFWGVFNYGSQNDGVNTMFNELYSRMGSDDSGTTVSGFKSGMTSYVNSKELSISFEQATGSYYNTDLDKIKSVIKQEKIAVIFMSNYTVTDENAINLYDSYSKISYNKFNGNHVMVVYGYYDIFYYAGSGSLVGRDTFLYVSTGDKNVLEHGLVNICSYTQVMDMYMVSIY
ncbi:MAG: hypothetical protein HDT28_01630 [Clostridiales bacterium]|nr:hypothetical protein [Clostridiales bacterium]